MSDLSFAEVGEILRLIESMDCRHVTLEYGDLRLQVRRGSPEDAPATDGDGKGDGAQAAPGDTALASAPDTSPATAPGDAAATAAAAFPPPEDESDEPGTEPAATGRQVAVRAPMAGTFYSRPAPGEPRYATPGDHVEAGQTIGLVEVMKLFTELKAETAGIVARICAEDGELVGYEQPLVWIDPS